MLVPSGVSAAAAGSHSDTGRPPNTAYCYKVSASNAGGEGLPSTAVLAGAATASSGIGGITYSSVSGGT
jgi:hypothetical protein